MDRALACDLSIHFFHELQELLVSMLRFATSDDGPVEHVECREQRGRPVPNVIVRARLDQTGPHRQTRLGSIQGLDLVLLIHRQDQCLIRWIQVQPDHVRSFSTNRGSRLSLKVRTRCGRSPWASQIRRTVASLTPWE